MTRRTTVMTVFGTRPEAIKMAPVVKALRAREDNIRSLVCVTAQHRQMLDQVLDVFKIAPDFDLNIMKAGQGLSDVTTSVLQNLRPVLQETRPDIVLVHGDTTTTLAASLAAFYEKIPVGHVEAGLRTWLRYSPFPEEMNRKVTSAIASVHFAPTEASRSNLLREGVDPASISVTGNTVIDALLDTHRMLESDLTLRAEQERAFGFLRPERRMILVTAHRRENFGQGIRNICKAIAEIVRRHPDVDVVYPVHLNPQVYEPAHEILGQGFDRGRVQLIQPVNYLPFVFLMSRSYLILTDSGGVQEEAPSLGKPVLVAREDSERPEAIAAGTARLVGASTQKILENTEDLLLNRERYLAMSKAHNPYGDGKAAARVVDFLLGKLNQ